MVVPITASVKFLTTLNDKLISYSPPHQNADDIGSVAEQMAQQYDVCDDGRQG
jgi:hypothetical protein